MNHEISKRIEGGNSIVNIYTDGKSWEIEKIYRKENSDWLRRIKREINALKLLKRVEFKYVPELVSYCEEKGSIKTTFLEGVNIKCEELSESMLRQIIMINSQLKYNRIKKHAQGIEEASDCFLSSKKFVEKLEIQLDELRHRMSAEYDDSAEKLNFIEELKSRLLSSQDRVIMEMGLTDKVFSFSDYGLHNCINKMGKLYFFDFEHSGWDDPAKGYCDWILRPNGGLRLVKSRELLESISKEHEGENMVNRIKQIMPIIGIKWMVIYMRYRKKIGEEYDIVKMKEVNTRIIEKIKRLID